MVHQENCSYQVRGERGWPPDPSCPPDESCSPDPGCPPLPAPPPVPGAPGVLAARVCSLGFETWVPAPEASPRLAGQRVQSSRWWGEAVCPRGFCARHVMFAGVAGAGGALARRSGRGCVWQAAAYPPLPASLCLHPSACPLQPTRCSPHQASPGTGARRGFCASGAAVGERRQFPSRIHEIFTAALPKFTHA